MLLSLLIVSHTSFNLPRSFISFIITSFRTPPRCLRTTGWNFSLPRMNWIGWITPFYIFRQSAISFWRPRSLLLFTLPFLFSLLRPFPFFLALFFSFLLPFSFLFFLLFSFWKHNWLINFEINFGKQQTSFLFPFAFLLFLFFTFLFSHWFRAGSAMFFLAFIAAPTLRPWWFAFCIFFR